MALLATSKFEQVDGLAQIHERRLSTPKTAGCYSRLTLAQKVSASHLSQFGFKLNFIRGKQLKSLAIFSCESLSVTVDCYGEIDSLSALYFRNDS